VKDSESDYSRFLPIRMQVLPTFDEDQESAARAIFAAVIDHLKDKRITEVVDLGCGTAEILDNIRAKMEAMPLADVRYLGIDCCAEEIAIAKELHPQCSFTEQRAEDFAATRVSNDSINAAETLLMCVGHTVPHFQLMGLFLDGLARWQPALVFVDLYDEWDALVQQLDSPDAPPVQQLKQSYRSAEGNLVTHVLTTKRNPNRDDSVLRGIETFCDGKPMPVRFWTTQLRKSCDWFRTEIEKRGYVLERTLRYKAGYGPMRAFLLSRALPQS
jgi:hypothetical protein